MNANTIIIPIRGTDQFYKRLINGKPLLAYTLEAARASQKAGRVIVSTDSEDVARFTKELGAEARIHEKKFSSKATEDVLRDVIMHLEKQGQAPGVVISLEITHPYRPKMLIDSMISLLEKDESLDTIITVTKEKDNFWKQDENGRIVRLNEKSQRFEREPLFREVLGIACATRSSVIKTGNRIGQNVGIIPIDAYFGRIDIRNEDDFRFAEQTLKNDRT